MRERYVVDGNTVRKEAWEQPAGRQERRQDPRRRMQLRRRQERALYMDLPYVVVLTIAAICALGICVNYLHMQSAMTKQMDGIETLEQKVETLKAENDALETRINTSVDLDYVYKVATEELGMVYAGKDQVVLYDNTESEYIRQNEDINENNACGTRSAAVRRAHGCGRLGHQLQKGKRGGACKKAAGPDGFLRFRLVPALHQP